MDTATNIACFVCACFGGGSSWVEDIGSFPPPFPHFIVWGQFTVPRIEFRPKTPTEVWLFGRSCVSARSSDVKHSEKEIAPQKMLSESSVDGRIFFAEFFGSIKKAEQNFFSTFRRIADHNFQIFLCYQSLSAMTKLFCSWHIRNAYKCPLRFAVKWPLLCAFFVAPFSVRHVCFWAMACVFSSFACSTFCCVFSLDYFARSNSSQLDILLLDAFMRG